MKTLLLVALVSLSTVSVVGQINVRAPLPSDDESLKALIAQLTEVSQNFQTMKKIQNVIGGLPITADRLAIDASGTKVQASGNVRIKTNEVVIRADDAVIENGAIQLGANARVVFDYPVKMIQ